MNKIEKIYVWGDSIMLGVVLDDASGRYLKLHGNCCIAGVEKKLNIPVKNFSHFGITSEKGLRIMEKSMSAVCTGGVALIEFGGNDVDYNWEEIAKNPEGSHSPKVSPENYESNLSKMVKLVRSKGLIPALINLPPISSKLYLNWFSKNTEHKENILKWLGSVERIYKSQESYSRIMEKTAEMLNCFLIDIRSAFTCNKDYNCYLCSDGIHPNAKGHRIMLNVLENFVRDNILNRQNQKKAEIHVAI